MKLINEAEVFATLSPTAAVDALRQALTDGYDPANDFNREAYELDGGQLLTMPSTRGTASGIKILTVSERAEELGVPRIQGNYLLFEGGSLTPTALVDGAALTSLRTPAASFAGVRDFLTDSSENLRVVIFGTGPQGRWHEKTLRDMYAGQRDIEMTYISRRQPQDLENWAESGSSEARQAVAEAELILCCTTASEPLVHRADVRDSAVIVAVGSHTPSARELASDLMGAGQVIVEDIETALREAGDVIQAIDEGALAREDLHTIAQVVTGQAKLSRRRPIIFKTTGMGWEDLVLAEKIVELAA